MNTKQRQDAFQRVTEKVLNFLKSGEKKKWRRPWVTLFRQPLQKSIAGRPYTGLNQTLLLIEQTQMSYASPVWATYKTWASKGYQVQKGEHGTEVTGWFKTDKVVMKDGKAVIDPVTKKPKVQTNMSFKGWNVFNGSQVLNAEGKKYGEDKQVNEPIVKTWEDNTEAVAKLNAIIKNHKVEQRTGGNRAFYNPTGDGFIQMPPAEYFESASAFYTTLSHEMIHWTGHDIRTGRHTKIKESKKDFNNNAYAFEELVAELGACFFDKYLEIENDTEVENHYAYLQSWIEGLENNPYMIERASQMAQKAFDYLVEDKTAEAELVEAEKELVSV